MTPFARAAAGALTAAALFASSASAEELIDGTDPAVILNVATGFGSASLSKDDLGDPLIEGRMNGLLYYVFFYGCKDGGACSAIQFSASFEDAEVEFYKINAWNSGKRFGTAFFDEDGDVGLQYDLNLAYGVSRGNLDDTFDYWRVVMGEFRSHLGW